MAFHSFSLRDLSSTRLYVPNMPPDADPRALFADGPADVVFIIGGDQGHNNVQELFDAATQARLKYGSYRLGKGQNMTPESLKELRRSGALGPKTKVIVLAHASVEQSPGPYQGKHVLDLGADMPTTQLAAELRLSEDGKPGWGGDLVIAGCEVGAVRQAPEFQEGGELAHAGVTLLLGNKKPGRMELASPVHDLIALMGWCKERGEEPPSADSCFNTIANVDGDCVSKVGDPHQKGPVAMHAPRTTAHFQGAAHEAQAFLDGVPSRLSGHPEDVADMARAFTPSTQEQQHAQMVRTLYVRAMRGTAEELGALLQAHPEMADSPDRGGRTLLHYAAAEGRLANVQLLLQRGANVNRKDVMGQTPLHCAVEDGHADVVRLLASTPDCDVNMVNNRSFTPLHTACLGPGNLEMAQALVAAGAKTGATNMGGFCALHFACASGNFELVDYLINEAKVDPHPRSGNRALNTPLDAVERAPQGEGKEKIKALLLSLPPPSFESRV